MLFHEVLDTIERSEGEATITVSAEWMQGRAMFGGLQTVLALQAMRTLVPDVPVRTLQTTFIAPPAGNRVRARANVLRQGKSATHVEARLLDAEDNVLAVVIGVFGHARQSAVRHMPVQPEVVCEKPRNFRFFPGISPTFTQYFAARWLKGGMPFSRIEEPSVVVELDMPDERASTESHVIAMADFIPPVALSFMTTPAPGSSMTWMLEFLTDKLDGLSMRGWRVDADMVAGADGYTHQSVMLWGPDAQPIALSRQNMVVFG